MFDHASRFGHGRLEVCLKRSGETQMCTNHPHKLPAKRHDCQVTRCLFKLLVT